MFDYIHISAIGHSLKKSAVSLRTIVHINKRIDEAGDGYTFLADIIDIFGPNFTLNGNSEHRASVN